MDEIKEEYELGLLTEKGFRMKKGLFELDVELREGDITPQGYIKKKRKLLDEVSTRTEPQATRAPQENFPASVLADMKSTSMHSMLNKLFNKGSKGAGKCQSSANKRKSQSQAVADDEDDSSKKRKTSAAKKEKAVTVVCVESNTISIPRNKSKLKDSGQMQLCLISPSDSEEEILEKLAQLYDEQVKMQRATKSGDLFELQSGLNGEEILDIVGTGCLYVKPLTTEKTPVENTLLKKDAAENTSEKKTGVVKPINKAPKEVNIDWELLQTELRDRSLINSYKMDCDDYSPENDDMLDTDVQCNSGETLLRRNHVVDVWIDLLQASTSDIPKLTGDYYIVPEEMMLQFDKFSEEFRKTDIIDGCVLRKNEIIKMFIQDENITTGKATLNNIDYCVIAYADMDRLCNFIERVKVKYMI